MKCAPSKKFSNGSCFSLETLKSIAEIEDIDLFIECANVCIIIENKIKSSQHSNQLYKYQYFTTIDEVQKKSILDEWVNNAFPHLTCSELNDKKNKLRDKYSLQKYPAFKQLLESKAPKYLYLNLIKEPVEGNWKNITYETVFNVFENFEYTFGFLSTHRDRKCSYLSRTSQ